MTLRRYELSDEQWAKVEPLLPGRQGMRGRPAEDNRKFLNAVMWLARSGAPWRDLPERYGDWKNTHRRFSRWASRGVWKAVFAALNLDVELDCLMMDSTIVRAHQHAAGAKRGLSELLDALAEA